MHSVSLWLALAALAASNVSLLYFALRARHSVRARDAQLAEARDAAAGMAHDLGSPLALIVLAAGEIERHLEDAGRSGPAVEDARLIRGAVDRCRRIVHRASA